MTLKPYRIICIVCAFLMLAAAGCKHNDSIPEIMDSNTNKTANELVMGVSVLDLANPYYVQIVNGVKAEAKKRNVSIMINDPKSDVDKQIEGIEEFIAADVDAIIIAALDQEALEDVLAKAMREDIKVIAQATKVENCDIYVSFDEWDMGHTIGQGAGKWIKEHLSGDAEVAILNYPRIEQIANREKGIRDGIQEFAPNAKVVATVSSANPSEGKDATIEILKKYPNVKVVVGINDGGALGALDAFEELGKAADDVFIGGIDATPEALEKIREGSAYRATVDINPNYSGMLDVDFAIKLIKGQIVPNRYSQDAILVTKDNIASY